MFTFCACEPSGNVPLTIIKVRYRPSLHENVCSACVTYLYMLHCLHRYVPIRIDIMQYTCLECHQFYDTSRTDSKFCSGACKASWYRKHGDTEEHADLNRWRCKSCEFCGSQFWFNDYANRTGKRVPTYCRDTCRVGAYRARQRDAAGRSEDQWRQYAKRQREERQAPPRQSAPPPPPPPSGSDAEYYSRLPIPRRWSAGDAYAWLRVPYGADKDTCQKSFRAMMTKYHPDKNEGRTWPFLVYISAAFDYIKRLYK